MGKIVYSQSEEGASVKVAPTFQKIVFVTRIGFCKIKDTQYALDDMHRKQKQDLSGEVPAVSSRLIAHDCWS
jgi:hypothetical protein